MYSKLQNSLTVSENGSVMFMYCWLLSHTHYQHLTIHKTLGVCFMNTAPVINIKVGNQILDLHDCI